MKTLLTFTLSAMVACDAVAAKQAGPAGGADIAPVQMLVPGFAVRALPVELPAINVVRYRADGKLMALGYDGKIHLLSDSDGDGLEDTSKVFYDPGRQVLSIGMVLTPPGYPGGSGAFIARKGSLVLELDTDGDDRADKEIVVAKDWETPRRYPGGVSDVIGVALDKEGNVFFGLGAANSQNGYLLENGEAHYNIRSERGTILKVPPDFSKREIFATGIRASVGLAFNGLGDLFCTDQEGATWMPNGNPFDELVHIERARHYGFPPAHPKYLPDVIDEPSVCDYGPQHQSTCGLQFDEPVNGGPIFGPAWWRGDALVAGESRGKLYRTKLVKTPAGYVSRNQILACLSWLTIDQCVSPQGDLVVSTHGGPPDWGLGPDGIGRLFKISYTDRQAAQPVIAYAASPTEVRVEFDRELPAGLAGEIAKHITLDEGWFVREGDRFESFRPGYRVVQMQQSVRPGRIPVLSACVSENGSALILKTPGRTTALSSALEINQWPHGSAKPAAGELPQASVLGLGLDLSGVVAEWESADGKTRWSGWLPHFDLAVARGLTEASVTHAKLWKLLEQPGTLVMRGQLDLWSVLRPPVQPGSRLDYVPAAEHVNLTFTTPAETTIVSPGLKIERDGATIALRDLRVKPRQLIPVTATVPTGGRAPLLQLAFSTAKDSRPRMLPLQRVLVPWAQAAEPPVPPATPPELAGGDRAKGEQLFQTVCVSCHSVNGRGGLAGPDLSNLVYRDYASVVKDIADPNAAINPDHVAFNVTLKNGSALLGVVIEDKDDELMLALAAGPPVAVKKAEISEMKASPVSLMPGGLDQGLGPQGIKDLLNYLMIPANNASTDTPASKN